MMPLPDPPEDADPNEWGQYVALPATLRERLYDRFPNNRDAVRAHLFDRMAELIGLHWTTERAEQRACWDTADYFGQIRPPDRGER